MLWADKPTKGAAMIVRSLASILNTAAHVKGEAFESRRILRRGAARYLD